MDGFIKIFIGFALLAGFFWLLELIWPEDRQQPKWRKDSPNDMAFWVLGGVVTRFLTGAVAIVGIVLASLAMPRVGLSFISSLPTWLQAILVLVVGDLIFYWTHRFSHTVSVLWGFHAVHHSSEKLDWLAAGRVHPLDSVFHRVAAIVPLYMLGFSNGVLAAYAPFLALYPIFIHANISWDFGPIGYIIASPRFHRWHHSSDKAALDKNFAGLFPPIDYLFGTAYYPTGVAPQKYGLAGEQMPAGVWKQLTYPFKKKKSHSLTRLIE